MVDGIELSIDEVKALTSAITDLKNAAQDSSATDQFKNALNGLGNASDFLKKKVAGTAAGLTAFSMAMKDVNFATFSAGLKSAGAAFTKLLDNSNVSLDSIKRLATEVGAFYALGSGRLAFSSEIQKMGDVADGTSAQMGNMYDRIAAVAPELVAKFGKVGPGIKKAFQQVDVAKKFETSLLMNAAAAGNLTSAMDSIGGEMTNLSDMTLEFSRMTRDAGTSNNVSAGQAAEYATSLMKIPGALGLVIDNIDGAGKKANMLDATMKIAAGTFQKFEDVMKDVNMLFLNWNKTGEDALTFVAKMSSAAQSLKMPMDIMRSYVKGVGDQFKYLGDNTMGAIDIMTRVGPAFENSGLGPAAVADLVKGMTGGVAEMDVAQRAFISAQTGGPGGLQGGYQIQQQLAEGDTAGVMSKVEDTLMGMFGGPVVTLKQAAEDSRAAAQYTKQVQMLTSGPLKMAGSEQEAKAILDAMSQGKMFDVGALGGGPSPEDAMHSAVERGNKIQDRQFNELVEINNQLQHFGSLAGDVAYAGVRKGIGPGTDEGQENQARQRLKREAAMGEGATVKFQAERPGIGREEEVGMAFDKAGEIGKGILETGKAIFGGFMGKGKPKDEEGVPGQGQDIFGEEEAGDDVFSTKKEINKQLDKQAAIAADITGAGGVQPRVRRDMATGQKMVDDPHSAVKGAKKPAGKESTIVIQVRSDQEIKKVVKFMIDEDGELTLNNEGKVLNTPS